MLVRRAARAIVVLTWFTDGAWNFRTRTSVGARRGLSRHREMGPTLTTSFRRTLWR